jgi:hypothetical protein
MNLAEHFDHNVVIARYHNLDGEPVEYSVDCEDCHETIIWQEA